ncbi:hypothetical protein NESM_000439400 [Novymonas esmeraldas]|uniref:Uncharacterized protein n=1 Tax=Novymonas esmeraldas TaxID=1808958 RepID=A0AAW0ENB1_9TRYP
MTDGTLDDWRDVLENVGVPLLPPRCRLAHYNATLMSEAAGMAQVAGGAAHHHTQDEPTVYRTLYKKRRHGGADLLEGGAYAAPVYGPDGVQTAVVDLSDTEAYIVRLSAQIEQLREEERAVGAAVMRELRDGVGRARQQGFRYLNPEVSRIKADINSFLRERVIRGRGAGVGGYRGGGAADGNAAHLSGGESSKDSKKKTVRPDGERAAAARGDSNAPRAARLLQ